MDGFDVGGQPEIAAQKFQFGVGLLRRGLARGVQIYIMLLPAAELLIRVLQIAQPVIMTLIASSATGIRLAKCCAPGPPGLVLQSSDRPRHDETFHLPFLLPVKFRPLAASNQILHPDPAERWPVG